jgi:AraC-like DNA-binding protein
MKEKLSAEKLTDIVFEAKGQISVSQLARMCNLSSRTLERHCYFNIGIGPKEFISIVRFKSAIWALESDKAEISGRIAVRMGYYDQSHFIKEIKKRTGFLPSCLFKIRQFP